MKIYKSIFEEIHSTEDTVAVYNESDWKKISYVLSFSYGQEVNPADYESGISISDFKDAVRKFKRRIKEIASLNKPENEEKIIKSVDTLKYAYDLVQRDELEGATFIAFKEQYDPEEKEIITGRPSYYDSDGAIETGRPQVESAKK